MKAHLVWDGGERISIPSPLGTPCDDQLTGTTGECLVELATRVCYDSLGLNAEGERKGRSSKKTLANVLNVGHFSVLEHYVRTIEFQWQTDIPTIFQICLNRPGVYLRKTSVNELRITTNIRSVLEWDAWTGRLQAEDNDYPSACAKIVGLMLRRNFAEAVPLLVGVTTERDGVMSGFVEPETDAERHITLYLRGSRGFSHEMVRHRFAISQRSTRFCQESESDWHWHPLINRYLSDTNSVLEDLLSDAQENAQRAYNSIVSSLETWLLKTLPEDTPYRKKHARKQARGAARGFLGNALDTQMFFTAPVWAWKHIVNMRASEAADGEIRNIISDAVPCLKASRYSDSFEDIYLVEAVDKMGLCLAGGGHK